MIKKEVCRCGLTISQNSSSKGFLIPGSLPRYAPDRPFRAHHLLWEGFIDPRVKSFTASVTHTLEKIASQKSEWIIVDQVDLEIVEVTIDRKKVEWQILNHQLHVDASTIRDSKPFHLKIDYQAKSPRRGLYFVSPDADYPTKPFQVWTQGEDEDSRYWMPTFDAPNQKITTELKVTVPKGFTAISNGALIAQKPQGSNLYFHYRMAKAHSNYLVTLVIGEFMEHLEKGPRGLLIQFFAPSHQMEQAKRSFKNTAHMIEVFEKKCGVPYPYEKYSQVVVEDFIFGGMENTSATTQTALTLHDERAALDFSSDPLVSHELAHQWFGDLVTCKDWSHAWLNEGFATFMERVWLENDPGPFGGMDEAKWNSYQDLKDHLAEDRGSYRRSIVCHEYVEPIDLFDTHLYQKGGLVLNLLRSLLGEEPFWKSVQFYLEQFQEKTVETIDLIRCIEAVTGRNMRRFFDEWVFQAGYPEFEVKFDYQPEEKKAVWMVEQRQTQGKPFLFQDGFKTPVFHLPVVLKMGFKDGSTQELTLELSDVKEKAIVLCEKDPIWVSFDPENNIPKTLKFPRSKKFLLEQLKRDPDCMGRIGAILELESSGGFMDQDADEALMHTLMHDSFWAVQAEAARVLGLSKTLSAEAHLISALKKAKPQTAREIVKALGRFHSDNAQKALHALAKSHASYFVEAEATVALGSSVFSAHNLQHKTAFDLDMLENFLRAQLRKESFRDVIKASALKVCGDFPGVAQGERASVLEMVLLFVQRGQSLDLRCAALRALGKIYPVAKPNLQKKIFHLFHSLVDENQFRLRMQLVALFSELELHELIPLLSRMQTLDSDGRVKRKSQIAQAKILHAKEAPESLVFLKNQFEKLELAHQKMRLEWEEIQKIKKTTKKTHALRKKKRS